MRTELVTFQLLCPLEYDYKNGKLSKQYLLRFMFWYYKWSDTNLDNFSIPEYAAVKYIILARFSMFLEYQSWLKINTSLSRCIKVVSIEGHIQKKSYLG